MTPSFFPSPTRHTLLTTFGRAAANSTATAAPAPVPFFPTCRAHGVQKVADGVGVGTYRQRTCSDIGFTAAGQVGAIDRTGGAQTLRQFQEHPSGARAAVQADERRQLVEAAAVRDCVVNVELAVAALEVGTAQAR